MTNAKDSMRELWGRQVRQPIDAAYVERRNPLWGTSDFQPVFKPLDDARDAMLKSAATLVSISAEHNAGNLSDDQVPRLRSRVLDEARKAEKDAERASAEALAALDQVLRARAFGTPPRGATTAEAKADLRMRLDHRDDVSAAIFEATDAAIASGDGLALRLLASDWGRDYVSARGAEGAGDVLAGVRAKAAGAVDLFPEDVRPTVANLSELPALEQARTAGVAALWTDLEGVETGRL